MPTGSRGHRQRYGIKRKRQELGRSLLFCRATKGRTCRLRQLIKDSGLQKAIRRTTEEGGSPMTARKSDYLIVVMKWSNVHGAKGVKVLRRGEVKHSPSLKSWRNGGNETESHSL
jgi:hypothetical protein